MVSPGKIKNQLRIFQGHFGRILKESQGLGLIYVILIKKKMV